MPTFLERYLGGDHAAVWDELVGLGEAVRQQPVRADAVAVAAETMRRVRHNLEILLPRLAGMGYRFATPALERELDRINKTLADPKLSPFVRVRLERLVREGKRPASVLNPETNRAAQYELAAKRERKTALEAELSRMPTLPPLENPVVFCPPEETTETYLESMEKVAKGPAPLSLRAWYEEVGSVSMMGSHDVLNPDGIAIADPLVVRPLGYLSKSLMVNKRNGGIGLEISPGDLRKAEVGRDVPYIITIPNGCADVELQNEWHQTTFVNYPRIAFRWAGFPGWERDSNPPHEAIVRLTEGLLPI
jgi:hypothetical protein